MVNQNTLNHEAFSEIHRKLETLIDFYREFFKFWNLKVGKLQNNQYFDVFYDWTHKRNSIVFNINDFYVMDNKVCLKINKKITYDRSMVGIKTGRIPNSPSTLKSLLEEVYLKVPWLIKKFPFLAQDNGKCGSDIELGDIDDMPKIAYRLAVIAVSKLSYIPIRVDSEGIPQSYDFNYSMIRVLIDYRLDHFI